MAKVGIFEAAPQKWFPFDADTEVLVEYVDKETLSKLIKQANEVSQKVKTPQGVAYDMFLGKKAVIGWRKSDDHGHPGFILPNGSALPFTAENRNMLMTRYREFSEFVFQKSTTASLFLSDDPDMVATDPATIEKLLEEYEDTEPKN